MCTANWASLPCKEDLKMLLSFQAGVKDALGSTALGCRTIPGSRPTAETSEMKKLTAQNVEKNPSEPQNEGSFAPKEHPRLARGAAAKWIHVTGSLEETSSDVLGQIFPSLAESWAKRCKTKAASWQAPPIFSKETGSARPASSSQEHKNEVKSLATTERRNAKPHQGGADNRSDRGNAVTAHSVYTAKGKFKVSHQIRQPN